VIGVSSEACRTSSLGKVLCEKVTYQADKSNQLNVGCQKAAEVESGEGECARQAEIEARMARIGAEMAEEVTCDHIGAQLMGKALKDPVSFGDSLKIEKEPKCIEKLDHPHIGTIEDMG
jgi:predicted Zn-dependent protease